MQTTEESKKLTLRHFDTKAFLAFALIYSFFLYAGVFSILQVLKNPSDKELNHPLFLLVVFLFLATGIIKLPALLYSHFKFRLSVREKYMEGVTAKGFWSINNEPRELEFAIRRGFLGYNFYILIPHENKKIVKMPFLTYGAAHIVRVKVKYIYYDRKTPSNLA
jgi:hypothetical protein